MKNTNILRVKELQQEISSVFHRHSKDLTSTINKYVEVKSWLQDLTSSLHTSIVHQINQLPSKEEFEESINMINKKSNRKMWKIYLIGTIILLFLVFLGSYFLELNIKSNVHISIILTFYPVLYLLGFIDKLKYRKHSSLLGSLINESLPKIYFELKKSN